jgi:hypothetical protein
MVELFQTTRLFADRSSRAPFRLRLFDQPKGFLSGRASATVDNEGHDSDVLFGNVNMIGLAEEIMRWFKTKAEHLKERL